MCIHAQIERSCPSRVIFVVAMSTACQLLFRSLPICCVTAMGGTGKKATLHFKAPHQPFAQVCKRGNKRIALVRRIARASSGVKSIFCSDLFIATVELNGSSDP
jgi:hypothetical protein